MQLISNTHIFTNEECDILLSLIDPNKKSTYSDAYRLLNIYMGDTIQPPTFFYEKLKKIGIVGSINFMINEYTENCYFSNHVDRYPQHPERVMTLIVNLSSPTEYGGGELYIDNKIVSKDKGSSYLFDSSTEHELKKITNGVRYSLIIWLESHNLVKETLI